MSDNVVSAGPGYASRPARTYTTGSVTKWLRIAAIAIAVACLLATIIAYPSLPEMVPSHFGPTGEPDAWEPRSLAFITPGILTVIVAGMSWLSHHPRLFNYPGNITEDNAQQIYRAGEQMIVWMTVSVALLICGATASAVFGLTLFAFFAAGMIGMVLSLAVGLTRMIRA